MISLPEIPSWRTLVGMEIRLTRHEPTGLVAVAVAREGDEMPHDVRLVDDVVGDAVEDLVRRRGLDGAVPHLDTVIARARARAARPAAG